MGRVNPPVEITRDDAFVGVKVELVPVDEPSTEIGSRSPTFEVRIWWTRRDRDWRLVLWHVFSANQLRVLRDALNRVLPG